MKKIIPILSLSLLVFYSCDTRTYDDVSSVISDTPTYTKDIQPIMTAKCTDCHSSGGQYPDLSTYENVSAESASILSEIKNGSMPPTGDAVTATQIETIQKWINTGKTK